MRLALIIMGIYPLPKKLVDASKDAGADIVKFQTFDVDSITSKYAEMAQYQKRNIGQTKSQKEILEKMKIMGQKKELKRRLRKWLKK